MGIAAAASILARRPLTGVIWNLMHGNEYAWRDGKIALRAHDIATLGRRGRFRFPVRDEGTAVPSVDHAEDVAAAAAREVEEETG